MPVDHKAEEHKSQNRMDTQNSNCLSITRILCWWNWAPGDWRDKTEEEEEQIKLKKKKTRGSKEDTAGCIYKSNVFIFMEIYTR